MENTAQTNLRLRRAAAMARAVVDPGPEGTRKRNRLGYFVASERTWKRIEIEFSAGATAEWLSAKYGPAVRTIGARAKAGGWRKKDVALKAEAAWDAADAAAAVVEEVRAARIEAVVEGGGDEEEARDGGLDLTRAMRRAQALAVEQLEKGDAKAAQEFLKLARMLAGDGDEAGVERVSPQDEAALAYVLARLEEEE